MHALGSKSERHSHSGEQTFWYVGDDDTNSEHKVLEHTEALSETEEEERDSKNDSHTSDDENEALNLGGKWGLLLLS